MFSDDSSHDQHKKHKLSADAYAARSSELYDRNIFSDIGRQSEHDSETFRLHSSSGKHSSKSKHGHLSSQHDRHHSVSREEKKQLKVCFVLSLCCFYSGYVNPWQTVAVWNADNMESTIFVWSFGVFLMVTIYYAFYVLRNCIDRCIG